MPVTNPTPQPARDRHATARSAAATQTNVNINTERRCLRGEVRSQRSEVGNQEGIRILNHAAKHLADLKAKLKITASQEAAWNTFADAMKPPADMMNKRPDHAEMDKLTTPERIDKMRAMHKEHMAVMEAAMDKRAEATKTFYAALSAEQKKTFDEEHARMDKRGEKAHHMPGGPDAKPAPKQ